MSELGNQSVTRRRVLRLAGVMGGAAALLAACGGTPASPTAAPKAAEPTKPAAAAPTTAPATAPTAAPKAAEPTKPAAAATTAPAAAAKPAAGGAAAVTLRLHARAGVEDEMFNKMLPKFEAANPGVTFVQEVFPGGEYLQKLQTLAAGGTIGDVLQLFTSDASYMLFFVGGTLASIDNYLKADNVDLNQWYKYSIDACRVDGKMGGLPFKSHPSRVGLFYNADLVQKAGLSVPTNDWTYDQLTEAAQKLNKPPDTFAFSHPWRDISYYPIMGRMYGGDFYAPDGKSTVLDKPESQQGWAWHYDMMNRHKVTLNPIQTAPTPSDVFVSGKLALFRANVGTKAAFARIADFKWGMVLAPKGPTGNRGSLAETDVEAMTSASKNPDKAWALLKLLTGKEAGIGLAQQTGNRSSTPGGRPDVYESPEHLGLPYPAGVQENSLKAMKEVEPWRGPDNFRGPEIKRLVDEQADLLLLDKAKPDKAFFDNLKKEIQLILDKPRP
ncbi:MAG: sugar ABC transporter substrate-binding protein [Chloroflexi bacterium]|nr:sugar ABC transporter substrate-binding protein [Chloroflexota bacterium]